MHKLSKNSIEIIDWVIAALKIPSNQQFYNQDLICSNFGSCGSVGCIGGWMLWLVDRKKHDSLARQGKWLGILDAASRLMRDTTGKHVSTSNLFGTGEDWIHPFANEYVNATSNKEQAMVAIARLEYFKTMLY
jgi:hypothetical protein